jgi:HTH-type transcriptional regulator / antitoxin HigA
MGESAKRLKPFINIPVGEFIKDELEFRGWNQEDLANIMGTSQKTVNQIIKGKQGITVPTAIKLGTIFGQSPEYWLNLYNTYCIIEAEKGPLTKSKTGELRKLYEKYPISELKKKCWIPKTNDIGILQKYIERYKLDKEPLKIAARTGNLENRDQMLRNTWVNVSEYCAGFFEYKPYNKTKLLNIANHLSEYTIKSNGVETLIQDLNDCGVGFLTLSHLPKTFLDGAVFSYKNNPIIVYTHRYDRTDNFWFTIAHEIAHVILHYNEKELYILDNLENLTEDEKEIQADEFAKSILKNDKVIECLEQLWYKNDLSIEAKINVCSKKVGICQSLVAGMLQFEWKSNYRSKIVNSMKKKIADLLPIRFNLDKILEKETAGT